MAAAAQSPVTSFRLPHGTMPAIGLGTYQSKPDEVTNAVTAALQAGYRHIDTAFVYWNETEVGKGIRQSGVPRDQIWLTTKLWNTYHRPEHVERNLDTSLKRLGVDYVDLYLMHWPLAFKVSPDGKLRIFPKGDDGKIAIDHDLSEDAITTWRVMENLVKKGKAKNIGICNFSTRRLRNLLQKAEIPPSVLQIEQSLNVYSPELLRFAREHNIVVQAYSPLGSTGASIRENAVVKEIAARHGCDPASVLISWPLFQGLCVLPKSITPARIEQNLKVVNLSAGDVQRLEDEALRINRDGPKRAARAEWANHAFDEMDAEQQQAKAAKL